jgi:hypothetical protein
MLNNDKLSITRKKDFAATPSISMTVTMSPIVTIIIITILAKKKKVAKAEPLLGFSWKGAYSLTDTEGRKAYLSGGDNTPRKAEEKIG